MTMQASSLQSDDDVIHCNLSSLDSAPFLGVSLKLATASYTPFIEWLVSGIDVS